ncbi:hypothetical protein AVEN_154917-1 [Araneus ventricosus]|uniref:RNase H type-1 domain-containing protein n=1 Tax=Araneus ventricosus TaxID=182803 RepID=A0A4Y2A8M9_ARAVE|nr:hypothetical protein AVEN_154917-1 [Araneus ventricosus]
MYKTVSTFSQNLSTGFPPIDIKIKEENEIWQQQQDIKNLEKIGIAFNFDYTTEVSPWKITSIPRRTFNGANYVGINVFTDGSKVTNRVGCAMVVFEDGNEKEHEIWRLNNETTVFIDEMVAIREAVNYCKRRQIAKANIIWDSISPLVSIKSLEENRKFILDIKNSLQDTNNNVLFWWTKAHAGNKGNERADYFAKKATGKQEIYLYFCETKQQRKTEMRKILGETGKFCEIIQVKLKITVRRCGAEAWRGGVPAQVLSLSSDRGSKFRGPSPNSPHVATEWDANTTKLDDYSSCCLYTSYTRKSN